MFVTGRVYLYLFLVMRLFELGSDHGELGCVGGGAAATAGVSRGGALARGRECLSRLAECSGL